MTLICSSDPLKKIIYVPGKNPKPRVDHHREMLWRVLCEGVRRINPRVHERLKHAKENFVLASWNFLFYAKEKSPEIDPPWIDLLLSQHGPSQRDIDAANHFRVQYDRMFYTFVDLFPNIVETLPLRVSDTVAELRRYFKNIDGIADTVREVVKKEIRNALANGSEVLLIGHSMGSIIAYDALWELTHVEKISGRIDTFLTTGSPLGMNYVQAQLLGHDKSGVGRYPASLRHWVNVSAVGDLVALDRAFADDFAEMKKLHLIESIEDRVRNVYNFFHDKAGLDCHRSYGYLINPVVSEVIANWWGVDHPPIEHDKPS